MQSQDLDIYQQLYELRSINRTAQVMGFAQSNITARLKALENELDVSLFIRSYQGLTPTTNGDIFYKYVTRVQQETQILHKRLVKNTPQRQHIAISTLLFDILVVQEQQYDLSKTTFDILSSTRILQLPRHAADLIVTYANFKGKDYLQVENEHLRSMFFTAKNTDSQSLPFLINADHNCPFRARTLRFLKQDHAPVMEIDSWDSIISLVKAGKGIALLPERLKDCDSLTRVYESHHFNVPYAIFAPQN